MNKRLWLLILCFLLMGMPLRVCAADAKMEFRFEKRIETKVDGIVIYKNASIGGFDKLRIVGVDVNKNVSGEEIASIVDDYESLLEKKIDGIYFTGDCYAIDGYQMPKFDCMISDVIKLSIKGTVETQYFYMNSDFYDLEFKKMNNRTLFDSVVAKNYFIYPRTATQTYDIKYNSTLKRKITFYVSSDWKEGYDYYLDTVTKYPKDVGIADKNTHQKFTVNQYCYKYDEENPQSVSTIYGKLKPVSVVVAYKKVGKKYSCYLASNGGKVKERYVEMTYDEKIPRLPIPVLKGYTFMGWFLNDAEVKDGEIWKWNEPKLLTAKWIANTYKVTLDYDNGEGKETRHMVYGKPYEQLPIPRRKGYSFLGWILPDGSFIDEDTVMTINKDHSIRACWENNTQAQGYVYQVKVSVKKKKGTKGYQIRLSSNKQFRKTKTSYVKTITGKKNKVTFKRVPRGGQYYMKYRRYSIKNKKKVYTKWSKVKKIKAGKAL